MPFCENEVEKARETAIHTLTADFIGVFFFTLVYMNYVINVVLTCVLSKN